MSEEETTPEQRAARAAYMRRYREQNPERYRTAKRIQRVRERALRILGNRHAEELRDLIDREFTREGT